MDCIVKHHSRQLESGMMRQIQCEVPVTALGEVATILAEFNAGDSVKLKGFLNRKSQTNQQLVLHVNHIMQI